MPGANTPERETLVGVISDTHGLMRPEALTALAGSDLIVHAGDVGDPDILKELSGIARTYVVRGNIDKGSWAAALPENEFVELGQCRLLMLHDISQLDFAPQDAGFTAVVFGHSHQPLIETRGGVLFLNPGSAGPRRFKLPVTVARLKVAGARMDAEIIELNV
ncbi:MAG TPA: metallophosphoesterase family protein [Xanthobacteraceae bacterium]|nr:metallophosphoesterase family protein [Xanthobacteraceae bacterium]